MDANKHSSISKAKNEAKIGDFWDTHDFTDFDHPETPDVGFDLACAVPIEAGLFRALEKQAQQRGVQVETLVNLWLQQKLDEQVSPTA